MKKFILNLVAVVLMVSIMACSTNAKPDTTLFTNPGEAWVFEKNNQKIAFTIDTYGYHNYIYDYDLDVVIGLGKEFHLYNNLLYFHHDWYDEQLNYLGVWGDSLFLAQHPEEIGNLYEYSIKGDKLTLTKPLYGYIDPDQAEEFGDVSYVFYKQRFTPPDVLVQRYNIGSRWQEAGLSIIHQGNNIIFSLKDPEDFEFYVYNIQGQRIWDASHSEDPPALVWNGLNYEGEKVPAGLYFFLLKTNEFTYMRDILLLM